MFCFVHVNLSTISTMAVTNDRMEPQGKSVAFCLSNESNYRSFIMRIIMSFFCSEIKLTADYHRIMRPVHTSTIEQVKTYQE